MQDLSITLVQADQIWEDKTANFENYSRLLSGVESDLIILPEMFQTGFSMDTSLAETMGGESIAWLKAFAAEKKAAIYTSLMIKTEDGCVNRGVFVSEDGSIQHYDKRKTFGLAGEDKYFESGTQETIVNYKNWNIQLQICYDLRFPEIVRNKILPNQLPAYDVIVYVANWPEKRSEHWKTLLKARAIENQCFVAGVNRVGKDRKNLNYSGDSQIIDALGDVEEVGMHLEGIKTVVLSHEKLRTTREMLPFLRER